MIRLTLILAMLVLGTAAAFAEQTLAEPTLAGPAPAPPPRPRVNIPAVIPVAAAPSTLALYGRLAGVPRPAPAAAAYRLMAMQEAAKAGLPYALVDAVMKIESGYDPSVIGGVGEMGLMQVRPATAAMLGFKGPPAALADPATNIHYGATYLAQAWHLAKGDVCRALMKYRAGHGEEMMSPLSVSYCARARAHLVAVGSPLAGAITPADLVAVEQAAAVARKVSAHEPVPGVGRARSGKAFWAAFESKVRRINARIEARWKRVASR